MTLMKQRLVQVGFAGLIALVACTPARADFQLLVTEEGGPTVAIVDGGPLDTDGVVNGSITAATSLLNASLTEFTFSSLGATSNRLFGIPGSADFARLEQTGAVQRIGTTGSSSIAILATDTDFFFPDSTFKLLNQSASDTFSNTGDIASRTFQSYFDPANTDLDESDPTPVGIPADVITFTPPAGVGPFAFSENSPLLDLGAQPTPFALTNLSVITLGPDATGGLAPPSDQFTGSTVVVPEPSSALILMAGLPIIAFFGAGRLRRMARVA